MQTLGFDNYVEPLKLYLQKYREVSAVLYRVELSASDCRKMMSANVMCCGHDGVIYF